MSRGKSMQTTEEAIDRLKSGVWSKVLVITTFILNIITKNMSIHFNKLKMPSLGSPQAPRWLPKVQRGIPSSSPFDLNLKRCLKCTSGRGQGWFSGES
eukprot:scaffold535786_cov20-Prasinocladus_malaysianus.AAC.1